MCVCVWGGRGVKFNKCIVSYLIFKVERSDNIHEVDIFAKKNEEEKKEKKNEKRIAAI